METEHASVKDAAAAADLLLCVCLSRMALTMLISILRERN